jgi:2-polyprenyl-3-methyl-5-hydroxy-6-metoxy-1,4-benzoquinol methylase
MASTREVQRAVRAYARRHRTYEQRHGEIFNDIEQDRLARALNAAVEATRSGSNGERLRALDMGTGTGNLTAHLVRMGLEVVAADVSPDFLRVVAQRFVSDPVSTKLLDGASLAGLEDASFDVVATYSVLHHVPDYLAIVEEMARVTKPGGVVFIDHEVSEAFWAREPVLMEYRRLRDEAIAGNRAAANGKWWDSEAHRWQRYLVPANYVRRVRKALDPKYQDEGDIHVFPDDHIEWPKVSERLVGAGCEIVEQIDYLLYRAGDPMDLYQEYADRCADETCLIARRVS